MAQLIEILLPSKDASGEDFPAAYYDDLAKELVANFGGVTSFLRAPAEGRWHDSGSTLARLLWVYRTDCGHERDVTPATIPLPPETPVLEVGKHMKCSKCGSRKINTKPELYAGGVAAMRRRHESS